MSSAGSPRKQPPASPSKRLKRKAADTTDDAGPSTSAGRSRTTSTSPFHPASASSSTTPSPIKRHSVSSRRNSRQTRTFQISDDFDEDEDAPYDEELDADGEFDEDYLGQDGVAEEDEDEDIRAVASSSTVTPARQSTRPKRSNALPNYTVQPLPSLSDDEQDEDVTPSIRRRGKKAKILPTSDVDMDGDDDPGPTPAKTTSRGTRTNTPSTSKQASSKTPRRPSEPDTTEQGKTSAPVKPPPEPEMSEEAKRQAKAEKEAHDLQSRWTEEYFEIVEQLPLEMHRTFALMRELEGQMQARVGSMVQNMVVYRDARLEMHKRLDAADKHDHTDVQRDDARKNSGRAGSEDEAETLLGGSQETPGSADDIELASADDRPTPVLLDKDSRRSLLRTISTAANESVKAAEEKMGLASTAYNWIDRHIRRLDGDISKLESSILLGLRSGTEESRGAREALGLPVGDLAGGEDGEAEGGEVEGVSAEAESAALTKAAGARKGSIGGGGGRRSARTTPKMGAQAVLAPSPKTSERASSRSRSRSASAAAVASAPSNARTNRQKTTSPSATSRPRSRKPKPLSPQKGGRRSLPSATTTAVGPDTSEMPFDPTEPTYCYCDQISFDDMVACDNDDCPIEWFHYSCVGLKKQPKKEWFCRFCAPKGWKGEGMDVPVNAKHRPSGWRKGVGIRG